MTEYHEVVSVPCSTQDCGARHMMNSPRFLQWAIRYSEAPGKNDMNDLTSAYGQINVQLDFSIIYFCVGLALATINSNLA
ncbi:uncharacterized protein RCO7_15251 [Rhynchosporium graminicola]|uniref:Uncharacterized protein n=1 Tax=Rhynchosporium graminicola TaxID=2792576 RepID=A0A1E1LSR8_9HELO|nr:uncharacterized protein RCO7_15251 [Rhynchosporium commune]